MQIESKQKPDCIDYKNEPCKTLCLDPKIYRHQMVATATDPPLNTIDHIPQNVGGLGAASSCPVPSECHHF